MSEEKAKANEEQKPAPAASSEQTGKSARKERSPEEGSDFLKLGGGGGQRKRSGDRAKKANRSRNDVGGGEEKTSDKQWIEKVIRINRTAAVVKGGRRFSFSALVVVGDGVGKVGCGFGKGREVPGAVDKALKDARKNLVNVQLRGDTIPHQVEAKYCSSKVRLIPAAPGTGLIAGPSCRAVMECAGIHNILTKVYGSTNPTNVVKAALAAMSSMRTIQETERLRGVKLTGRK